MTFNYIKQNKAKRKKDKLGEGGSGRQREGGTAKVISQSSGVARLS